jgi:3-hydroxyisobutyrate dehydrogenase
MHYSTGEIMAQTKDQAFGVVGFVGLGAMGGRMVRNLKGVADLLVYDVDPARAKEAAAAVSGTAVGDIAKLSTADAVILMLPTSAIVDEVFRGSAGRPGLLDILAPGSLVIDMSSSVPTNSVANAALAQKRGITFIDAPVSGGIAGAESAKLAIMAGGAKQDFERARPLLDRMGSRVILVGDIGTGHAIKALNNLLAATIFAATSEVFTVGTKFGLDPTIMREVINASSGSSFMTEVMWPKAVLPRSFDFGFTLQLMEKDVRVAMSLIEATGVETALSNVCASMWSRALKAAPPGADMSTLLLHIEQGAGTGGASDRPTPKNVDRVI